MGLMEFPFSCVELHFPFELINPLIQLILSTTFHLMIMILYLLQLTHPDP